MHMKKFIFIIFLSILSSNCFGKQESVCSSVSCDHLLAALDKGVKKFSSSASHSELLQLRHDQITKIVQTGSQFEVCVSPSRYYVVEFHCSLSIECEYIAESSVHVARTSFEQCL